MTSLNIAIVEGRIAEDPIWEEIGSSGYSCRFPIITHNIHDKLSECVIQVRTRAECIDDGFLVKGAEVRVKGRLGSETTIIGDGFGAKRISSAVVIGDCELILK